MGEFNGKKRSELPDSVFGIPQERKYPMPDEKHTRSAIKLFNHVDPKYEEQLAKAVIKNMKKYGIDGSAVGPNNRLKKYLPKNMIKESYIDESVSSAVSKDHKQKGYIKLSSLKKTHITEFIINKYKKEYPVLRHVRCKDTDEYICDGYMWFKENDLVCYVGSCQYTDDNTKWIVSLEILPEYRGYGLSNQILDFCIKNMKCRYLSVNKNNELAKKIYDKYGFKTYHEDKTMYYMTLDNISSSNESMISTTEKAKYDPPYTAEEVKRVYGTKVYKELIKDPAHKYRMGSGIELIHREPTKEELERIWKNWNLMSDDQKMKSDKKSMELFGKTNQDHYNELINSYVVNESYIEEGYFKSTDNLEFNLNKWSKSGPHNLLYITGISGSGKTTLAKEMCKKYKTEYIELDKFTLGIVKGLDRWFEYVNNGTYEVHPLLKEYFSQLDHLTTNGSWSKPDMGNEHTKFLAWLINKVKGNGRLYIVEGAQFFMKLSNMDPGLIKGEPLIVVGTSAFKSWIRRIKRDTANDETISRFIYHLKKDVPMLFKYYFSNERDLQKYIKNMYVNEATNYTTQETGISTIIFDIGDVLIRDNFKKFLKSDPDIPNELADTIKSLWFIAKDDVDDTMDLETYREIVNKRMGVEFSKYIPKLFQYGVDAVEVLDYTIPMIQDLKNKGYKVYYLSNWSAWTHDLLQEAGKFDFLKYMDGGVFSYDVGYRKPDPEIYQILLNRYKINPEEAVFFDDKKENIETAKKMGIHSILFDKHDSAIVYNALEQFHILYKGAIQSINDISKNHRSYGYNVLQDATVNYMNEISLGTKIDEDKVAKEILNIVRPIIISQENKSKASKMGLTLKCKIEEVDSGMIFVLVLDGSQDRRDTDEARAMLKELASKCKSKLSDLVSKVDIGDGDEGCLYFTMDKNKIKRNRKYLIKESAGEEITKSGINDIKEIISILDDDDFKNFKFTNIAYYDIRYRNSKPIAFITIRTKPVNNCTVGYVSLAVIPKYQDQGIGRSLTEKAIKWFKKNKGIDFLEWHCLPDNAASNRLANDAGFSKYIAKDESEYNTYTMESVVEESKRKNSLYFYHIVDDNADISKGLLSLGYMYKHDKSLFLKNAAKYRNRLCDSWGIYPNRDPESLTAEEIYEGIKLHRNEDNLNTIYFFKFPPYSSLHKEFERLYRCKKIYRIDINDPKVKSIIKNINYGWVDSNMNNKPLDREYYETVSIDDYFDNFDKDKWPLFSTLYHISIEVKNGYIPKSLLTRVNIPKTIEDVKLLETSAIVDRLLRLEPGADPMAPDVGVSLQEYGTTGGTIVGTNQPDSVYIVNYMQNNVFSGHKEQKQAICKKGMNQMYTTKNGKSVSVDKNKFKEEASDVSVFRFKGSPFLSYDKIVESAIQDSDYYSLLTGDDISSPEYMKYDNRFIEEEPYTEYLDDITSCIESSIVGTQYSEEYPYMKVLTESVDGRCWNYYNDINGYFIMNELTGLRSPSYDSIEEIPESQIKVIERGTIYLGE